MFSVLIVTAETAFPRFDNSPNILLLVALNTMKHKQIAAKQTNGIQGKH